MKIDEKYKDDPRRTEVARIEYCRRIIEANGAYWQEVYGPGGTSTSVIVSGPLYVHAQFGQTSAHRATMRDWEEAALHVIGRRLSMGSKIEVVEWFPPWGMDNWEQMDDLMRIEDLKCEIVSLNGCFAETYDCSSPRLRGGLYCCKGEFSTDDAGAKSRATVEDWESLRDFVIRLREERGRK